MSLIEHIIGRYEQVERPLLVQTLQMLESGEMRERGTRGLVMVDTTAEAIGRIRGSLSEHDALVAEYSPKS